MLCLIANPRRCKGKTIASIRTNSSTRAVSEVRKRGQLFYNYPYDKLAPCADASPKATRGARQPKFRIQRIDFLNAGHRLLIVSRGSEALRLWLLSGENGSQPRHSPGHLPGLPFCEVRHAKRLATADLRALWRMPRRPQAFQKFVSA
jgi:hypothetical protein